MNRSSKLRLTLFAAATVIGMITAFARPRLRLVRQEILLRLSRIIARRRTSRLALLGTSVIRFKAGATPATA